MASLATLAVILLVLGLYWLPSIIACMRRHSDVVTIVAVNALLGWTFFGWLRALTIAARQPSQLSAARAMAGQADGPDGAEAMVEVLEFEPTIGVNPSRITGPVQSVTD